MSVRAQGIEIEATDAIIGHTGYVDEAITAEKVKRNLRLLELDCAEWPWDFAQKVMLARTLLAQGDTDRCLEITADLMARYKTWNEPIFKDSLLMAFITKSSAENEKGDVKEAIKTLNSCKYIFQDNVQVHLHVGELYYKQGDYKNAYDNLKHIGRKKTLELTLFPTDANNMLKAARYYLMISSLHVGDFRTAEFCIQMTTGNSKYTIKSK